MATRTKIIKKTNEVFASEEFGKSLQIDWIWTEWALSEEANELAKKVLGIINDEKFIEIIPIFEKLIDLNPTLERFRQHRANLYHAYHIILGCISKYILEDIEFFVLNYDRIVEYNFANRPLKLKLEIDFGHNIQWVMSPKTQMRLIKELKNKLLCLK